MTSDELSDFSKTMPPNARVMRGRRSRKNWGVLDIGSSKIITLNLGVVQRVIILAVSLFCSCGARIAAAQATTVAEWPYYGGDAGGQRYSTLDQINKQNVKQLKVAWTYHTGDVSFDTDTGEQLWEAKLPAGGNATPMTYQIRGDGKQYVVIAAGGHGRLGSKLGDSVVAFALP